MAAVNAIAISIASRVLSGSSSSIRDQLENVRTCWFWLLIACTAIVAVGVVLESAEDWFPLGKPSLDTNTGTFRPSSLIRRRKMVINLGWQLVLVGVIGEGIFEVATSGADETLQQFNNTLLALTTEQAGSAAKSAKTAHEEADATRTVADEALGKSKEAVGSSSKALNTSKAAHEASGKALKTSNAATDAALEARKRVEMVANQAAGISKELQQAEYLLSARSLIDVNSFVESLKKFNGKTVNLMSYVGDAESGFLCESLNFAMNSAGMKPTNNCGKTFPVTPVQTNVGIWGPDVPETTEFGNIVANGIYPDGAGITPRGSTPLTVLVGIKPPFTVPMPPALTEPRKKQTNTNSAKP